jgi:hypothetical protein
MDVTTFGGVDLTIVRLANVRLLGGVFYIVIRKCLIIKQCSYCYIVSKV